MFMYAINFLHSISISTVVETLVTIWRRITNRNVKVRGRIKRPCWKSNPHVEIDTLDQLPRTQIWFLSNNELNLVRQNKNKIFKKIVSASWNILDFKKLRWNLKTKKIDILVLLLEDKGGVTMRRRSEINKEEGWSRKSVLITKT